MIDAGRRGFSRWRVATALGVTPRGLASIERLIDAFSDDDARGGDGPRRQTTGGTGLR